MAAPKNNQFSVKYIPTLDISIKTMIQISEFHFHNFWLLKGNDMLNILSKFQDNTSIFNGNFNCPRWQPTPLPTGSRQLTLPLGKIVPPIFFHQSDREECPIDHLDGLDIFLLLF